jgi:hypothetical protein
MLRAVLISVFVLGLTGTARPTQDVYPPLTRETLVGTWEGVFGIGTHPVVLHFVIAPRDTDSYLSEVYPDSMQGRLFRLTSCTVAQGKVDLDFRPAGSAQGAPWRIEGEGFGDQHRAWINSRMGYFERSTWVRQLGDAASRAAENIPASNDSHK